MICKKCGAQIEDTSTECKFCGATYDTAESVNEEPTENVKTVEEVPGINNDDAETDMLFDENEIKRQRQLERMRAEKQSQLDEIEKRRKEKQQKQKRTKVLVVLVSILCLGAAAFGGYYIFSSETASRKNRTEVIIEAETNSPTEMPIETETPEATASPSPAPSEIPTQPASVPVAQNTNTSSGNVAASGNVSNNGAQAVQKPKATQKPVSVQPKATQKPAATVKPSNSSSAKPSTSSPSMNGEYTADGGMVNGNFSSALVTGVDIVKNGDKTYMSFKYNGSMYYAKVSDNTTSNFIAGKSMTISAYKISETYNGVNVYEITAITHYNGTYVFPNSGFKLLTEADLAGKSTWELRVGRNEIYARHGRKFNDNSLQTYFNGCAWYRVKSSYDYSNDANNLNSIERANAAFIRKYEQAR